MCAKLLTRHIATLVSAQDNVWVINVGSGELECFNPMEMLPESEQGVHQSSPAITSIALTATHLLMYTNHRWVSSSLFLVSFS